MKENKWFLQFKTYNFDIHCKNILFYFFLTNNDIFYRHFDSPYFHPTSIRSKIYRS